MSYNSYQKNFSSEEFLKTSFILLKRKLLDIYELTQKEQSVEIISERYKKTSDVLQALALMQSMIDFSQPNAKELSDYYLLLEQSVFEGNHSNPALLLGIAESL